MAAVFVVIAAIAGIHGAVRYQIIFNALVDKFPPQFRGDFASHYALPVFALDSSTPLPLQASYMSILWSGCVAFLSVSLAFFSSGNVVFGCFVLLGFFAAVGSTIRSWKTYKKNRNRAMTRQDKEQP